MPFPGQFVIRTFLTNNLVTARPGNHSVDAIVSNATSIGPNEKFTLEESGPPLGTTLRTASNFFVSARGNIGAAGDTGTFQTEETLPDNNAKFTLAGPATNGSWTIRLLDGHFVTAVGGGGQATRAFHTDATVAKSWESFYILKTGDLGSGLPYVIRPAGTGNVPGHGEKVSFLTAINGGNRQVGALTFNGPLKPESHFNLIAQPDGSFAFKTSNGFTFITADDGGGLAHGTPQMDNLITTKSHVQDWEKFRIAEAAPGLYTVQTISGFFIGVKNDLTNISTRISFPDQAPSISYTAFFELMMLFI
jgi:hypothetical protein